jgi:DNA-binding PadR family transcriptional regulator
VTDRTAIQRFLPLPSLDFQVLTLVATRRLHGYGLIQASSELFPGQPPLDVGTLYRIISRMLDQRLIREVKAPDDAPEDKRVRRYYLATDLGREVARAEAARMRALLGSQPTIELLGARR